MSFFHLLTPELWEALWLTLRLAFVVMILLVGISIPMAYGLSLKRNRGLAFLETLVSLPIVLPPTVIGFYLLVLFSPQRPFGAFWVDITGRTLTFSFEGLVIGSIIYSLPYTVQPILGAFRSIHPDYRDLALTLGAEKWQVFRYVLLPMSVRGISIGAILGFAHTLGEFGLVMMLGGSIPGKTRVASIALYDEVQKLSYDTANAYALLLVLISFGLLLLMNTIQRRIDLTS